MSSQNFGMKSYMKGALLLTMAALIVKVLSAVYRVPFQNLVGDQGFYVYQQVYPFIAIFVTWTTGGVAVAISKMLANYDIETSEGISKRRAILTIIFGYLSGLSLLFFALLYFGAPMLAHWMADDGLIMPLKVGAFVTLCMPVLALAKGSFQSRGLMAPVAYSQVFEQTIRVSVILIGTIIIMSTTKSIYSAGTVAIFGSVIGEIAAISLLIYFMSKQTVLAPIHKIKLPKWPIIKELTIFSLSVSMSSLLLLTFQLVDSFTIFPMLVEAGLPFEEAQVIKGIYDRGQPLVQLGLVIASSLALAIVPLVAYKSAKSSGRGAMPFVQLTYRATLLFAVAAAIGLVLVMPYVNEALFKSPALSDVLRLYSLQIIPLSLILTMTAILQGYSKLLVPALLLGTSLVLKIIGNVLLIPLLSVEGVALTSLFSLLICALGLVVYLRYFLKTTLASKTYYIHLSIASFTMCLAVMLGKMVLQWIAVIDFSPRLQAVVYSAVLILLGAFTFITVVAKFRVLKEKEWFLIPLGRRMAAYQLWLNRKK